MMVDSNFDGSPNLPIKVYYHCFGWLEKKLVDAADDNLMIYKTITTKTIKNKKKYKL